MKFFGPKNRQLGNLDRTQTPVGEKCAWCNEQFIEEDVGLSIPNISEEAMHGESHWHRECFLRTILGSVGHLRKQCSCHGGSVEDPPELTKREAALAAISEWEKQNE